MLTEANCHATLTAAAARAMAARIPSFLPTEHLRKGGALF
jgi:hypothetical protein